VIKFGGPAILKGYVRAGSGDCRTTPILCIVPDRQISNPVIDKGYLQELLPYDFPAKLLPFPLPHTEISIPKGFAVIRGNVTKVYYKKRKYSSKTPAIYLLYQKPKFFPNLFYQLKSIGVDSNYEFVNRTLYAQFSDIDSIYDAFFVIMKSIFTPNVGQQNNVKVVRFSTEGKRGFITYNFSSLENYFDCDIITKDDAFCKIYIKDKGSRLNLDKVIAIISTMNVSD
jgi:hypothetical protein